MSKPIQEFQRLVADRADQLRVLTYQQLLEAEESVDYVTVGLRRGRISTILNRGTLPSQGIRVVIQGFLKKRFFPMIWSVALNGFYKYPDETTAPLTREDIWEFD